jgi:putative flavoprotein involved in K+ transport
VRDGLPLLADQRALEVANVVWCTGFRPDFSWIDLSGFDDEKTEPQHYRGIVADEPGLYFVGLFFLYAMSSGFLPGVGRDAEHVVNHIAAHRQSERPSFPGSRPLRSPEPRMSSTAWIEVVRPMPAVRRAPSSK